MAEELKVEGAAKSDGRLKKAWCDFAEATYRDYSRFRFAEEREWYEVGLFYQRRQWLSWSQNERRWKPIEQDKRNPKPMPVSNYFALTINANANQLAAALPRMQVSALSDADQDQRAADMAEKAIPAIDKESGMRILNPLLAKHTVLWGMGVTKDVFDASASTGRTSLPKVTLTKIATRRCNGCGANYDVPVEEAGAGEDEAKIYRPAVQPQPAAPVGTDGGDDDAEANPDLPDATGDGDDSVAGDDAATCPTCGGTDLDEGERTETEVEQVMSFTRGKITTEVRPIFEIYLPRDCQNPNLAKRICQRYRKPVGHLERLFPQAKNIQEDQPTDVHEVYLEALRSLVMYSHMHQESVKTATATEVWADWDELSEDLQQEIEAYCADDPETLENYRELGGYAIVVGGETVDYGANPLDGKKPYTFYLWELDPANVYPKGLGVDLVPLQKRLNRLDSLMELGMMTNAAGKWLWPKTQTTDPPSGSPSDVIEYDVIGDGKVAPQFVQPSPFHQACWQMRQAILGDFQQLGLSLPASKGEAPEGVTSFRGVAYLGAKADEAINTQRFLYEMGHQLRCEKTLRMAAKWWDEPRRLKVAGPNGRYMMHSFTAEDLAGDYEVELIPGSSKPRTIEEKQAAFAGLLQAHMVDPSDFAVREFVMDLANLPEIDLADSLQILKAERTLEAAKQGVAPAPNPFLKFDVFLRVFVNYILTEEFDMLAPGPQQVILQAAQAWSHQLQQIQQSMNQPKPPSESLTANFKDLPGWAQLQVLLKDGFRAPAAPAPGPATVIPPAGGAPGNPAPGPGSALQAVPGATASPAAVEGAALAEARQQAR